MASALLFSPTPHHLAGTTDTTSSLPLPSTGHTFNSVALQARSSSSSPGFSLSEEGRFSEGFFFLCLALIASLQPPLSTIRQGVEWSTHASLCMLHIQILKPYFLGPWLVFFAAAWAFVEVKGIVDGHYPAKRQLQLAMLLSKLFHF